MTGRGLRYELFWLTLGWLGVGLLVYLSLTPKPHHVLTFSFGDISLGDKIEHVAAFGVTMLWFGQIYTGQWARGVILLALVVAGYLLEVGQWHLGGYAGVEYGDVAASAVGVFVGWWLLRTAAGTLLAGIERWFHVRGRRATD